jgi:DNA-binding ferritin-like protein
MAKYSNTFKDYWTYITVSYDSETLIQTVKESTGFVENVRETSMTKEEMLAFVQKEYTDLLKSMHEEIKVIQKKYDERIKRLEEFTKALDK